MGSNRPTASTWESDRHQTTSEIIQWMIDELPWNPFHPGPAGTSSRGAERTSNHLRSSRHSLNYFSAFLASSMSSGSDQDLRRRFNRDPQTSNEPLPSISSIANISGDTPHLPPLRTLGSRRPSAGPGSGNSGTRHVRRPPGMPPSDRVHRLRSSNFDGRNHPPSFQDMSGDLGEANSHLRALLELDSRHPIIPPLTMPALSPPLHAQDQPEENRRIKRRKLDSDKIPSSFKGFRYGKYGQVEPGPLTMEIVSCDGGLFSTDLSYSAENILKNDSSVYCTKGHRCNIVLRHQGATVFNLKELVIKAPGSNYSSPVREGMVFVSMNQDELLTRTAQYQIQYVPARRPISPLPGSGSAAYASRSAQDDDPYTRAPPRRRTYVSTLDDEEDDEYQTAQIPSEFCAAPPPFNITAECSGDESDGEGGMSTGFTRSSHRRPPNRIGSLPFESGESDDDDDAWGPSQSDWVAFDDTPRSSADQDGNPMTLAEAQEASQLATQEAVRAVGGELMTPLVHFHIEQGKSRCTIHFDPPVSGRFILLKMWSPNLDPSGNIDIQAVIARGYAGPRYIPSVELR